MNLNINKKLKRLYKSSWFITLFATMFGVLLAFYLDDLSSQSKVEKRMKTSIRNIDNELTYNIAALRDSSNNNLSNFLGEIRSIDSRIPNELTMSTFSMNNLIMNYSNFIEVNDSTSINGDLYKYNIGYKFELNLDDIQNIAWETFKMSNINSELNYNCLQILVQIYSLQEIYLNEQQKTLNYFINAEHKKLLNSLSINQQLKSQLLNVMSEGQEKINNCS